MAPSAKSAHASTKLEQLTAAATRLCEAAFRVEVDGTTPRNFRNLIEARLELAKLVERHDMEGT